MKKIEKVWSIYETEECVQKITSAKTARVQIPKTFKVIEKTTLSDGYPLMLDIGCGSGNRLLEEAITNIGVDYNGCDPFNKSKEYNLISIHKCMNGMSDLVTINNVLNTVSEKEIRESILLQCRNALKEDGILIVLIYEGAITSAEKEEELRTGVKLKELTPIKTRDGWQNRAKPEFYLPEITSIFENVKIQTVAACKLIVASKNSNLDIDLKKRLK